MEKYQVISTNCSNNMITILHTTSDYNESVAFLNNFISENFSLDEWCKAYYESSHTVSIYLYHYVWPKELIYKIHITKYTDC